MEDHETFVERYLSSFTTSDCDGYMMFSSDDEETEFEDESPGILAQIEGMLASATINGHSILENYPSTPQDVQPVKVEAPPIEKDEIKVASKGVQSDIGTTERNIEACLTRLNTGIDQMNRYLAQLQARQRKETVYRPPERSYETYKPPERLNSPSARLRVSPSPRRRRLSSFDNDEQSRYERAAKSLQKISQASDDDLPLSYTSRVVKRSSPEPSPYRRETPLIESNWKKINSPLTQLFTQVRCTIDRINGYSSSNPSSSPQVLAVEESTIGTSVMEIQNAIEKIF